MSASYKVVYSPEALNDLKDIYAYIAQELLVPGTAKSQINRIRKEIRSLDFMPARYAFVDWEPWKSMGMHKLPVDNFVVFYTVDGDSMTVTVIRIVYGGRDIESLAATDYEWARCKMEPVRTTRKTGGLHKPYKGIVLAAPQGAVKRSADRIGLRAAPPSGAAFICSF